MRNPILIFPIGIILLFLIALISVHFGAMTMDEYLGKLKMFSILLIPIALFGGAFAYTEIRQKRDKRE